MKQRNKETNKEENDVRVKMFLVEEAFYKAHTKNWGKRSKQASSQRFCTQ